MYCTYFSDEVKLQVGTKFSRGDGRPKFIGVLSAGVAKVYMVLGPLVELRG